MKLSEAKLGMMVRIESIEASELKTRLMSMGLEGDEGENPAHRADGRSAGRAGPLVQDGRPSGGRGQDFRDGSRVKKEEAIQEWACYLSP